MSTGELPESWEIPIGGFEVIEVWFSGRIHVVAYGRRTEEEIEAPNTRIAFGGRFFCRDQTGLEHRLDAAAEWETLTPLLSLRHACVSSATADRSGHLSILFDNSALLSVGPDEQYENWELSGPGRLNLVGMPGGGDPRISH